MVAASLAHGVLVCVKSCKGEAEAAPLENPLAGWWRGADDGRFFIIWIPP